MNIPPLFLSLSWQSFNQPCDPTCHLFAKHHVFLWRGRTLAQTPDHLIPPPPPSMEGMEAYNGNDYPYLPPSGGQNQHQHNHHQPQIVTNHYTHNSGTLTKRPPSSTQYHHPNPYGGSGSDTEWVDYSSAVVYTPQPNLPPPPPDYESHTLQHSHHGRHVFSPDLGFNSPSHHQIPNHHPPPQHGVPPGPNNYSYSNGGQAYFSGSAHPPPNTALAGSGVNNVCRVNPGQEAIVRQLQEKFGEEGVGPPVGVTQSNGGPNHHPHPPPTGNGNGRSSNNGGLSCGGSVVQTNSAVVSGSGLCCGDEGGGCIIPYSKLPLLLLVILFLLTLFLTFSGALLYFKCK